MSIQIGRQAPTTALVEAYVRGETEPRRMTLGSYRGRWVVLFFYPRDFTFICPTELQTLAALHADFDREGAVVVAASTDSFYSHKAWYETDPRLRDVSYPVLADTAHTLAKSFGVLLEDGTALRGTFIIDPHGIVRHLQVNDLSVGRNPEETLRTLQALRTGELCPVSWRPGERTISTSLPMVA
jgi:peroxiredoxin (alkyl hydroperoxide reductase subunit C)